MSSQPGARSPNLKCGLQIAVGQVNALDAAAFKCSCQKAIVLQSLSDLAGAAILSVTIQQTNISAAGQQETNFHANPVLFDIHCVSPPRLPMI